MAGQMPVSVVSGQLVAAFLSSGSLASGSVFPGAIGSGAVTSGAIGMGAIGSGNLDATALSLFGSSDYDKFRAPDTCSGLAYAASGMGQRWYPAGFATGSPNDSLVTFPGQCIYALPICSENGGVVDDIRVFRNHTVSGTTIYLALYDNIDSTMCDIWPGTLLGAVGILASGNSGPVSFNPGAILKPSQIYWLAMSLDGPNPAPSYSMRGLQGNFLSLYGVNSKFEMVSTLPDSRIIGIRMTWSGNPTLSGAGMPSTFPTTSGLLLYNSGYIPAIAMHYASKCSGAP